MARPKTSKTQSKKDNTEQLEKKKCPACGKEKATREYFQSVNPLHSDGLLPYCKDCISSLSTDDEGNVIIENFKNILMQIDKPFLQATLDGTIEECDRKGSKRYVGWYMKNLALNFKYLTYKDSDHLQSNIINNSENNVQIDYKQEEYKPTDNDKKNKEDVIRMLGYDPFETEYEVDKPYLYSRLIDYLDESALEDSFKLSASIEIIKSFNQIDKINHALSLTTRDVRAVAENVGGIKSLFDAKEKILKSVLALAKDNGISVNHNNNKSKGGNTLNGIVKKLTEIGLSTAELNLFDLETCDAMKQIADFSNKSILEQLMLDENDYTEMIAQQNEMIKKLDQRVIHLEEENRLLKLKLK